MLSKTGKLVSDQASAMPGALYCFRGPDRVRKLERIRQLADQLHIDPLDQHLLNAAQVSTSEFLGLIREHPMNSPLRLVVIDEAHRLEEACLKALAEQGAREASQTACVVLLVESDVTKKPAWQALCARASIEEFSEAAAKTPDHFALLNAIARRDVPSALQGLREQLAGGKDEIELLGLIVWQLQRWLTLAHLMTAATPRAQMETAMGWNSWQVERMTGELKGRSVAWLQEALEDCWQLDRDAKSGRRPLLTTALEQMVVSLCLPAPREQSAAGSASPIACSNAR